MCIKFKQYRKKIGYEHKNNISSAEIFLKKHNENYQVFFTSSVKYILIGQDIVLPYDLQ